MNAIVLPAALRFNAELAPEAVRRFGEAIGAGADPAAKVEELAALSGPIRLRDVGVPEADLPGLAVAAAGRAGNRANPRPATVEEVEELYRSIW
jgi:alcohol dehydrogenase class IV